MLASLVTSSLVRLRQGEEPRFGMLETVREHAAERLTASGEEEPSRAAHARLFLSFAEEAEPNLKRREQLGWFARLDAEHPNLQEALAWFRRGGDADRALRLVGALWYFR